MVQPIEYADASPEVRAVYDDIKATRGVDDVNNFWKYAAHHPAVTVQSPLGTVPFPLKWIDANHGFFLQ